MDDELRNTPPHVHVAADQETACRICGASLIASVDLSGGPTLRHGESITITWSASDNEDD